jgi:ribosomal protein S18 acetylase RimI-like enzyme
VPDGREPDSRGPDSGGPLRLRETVHPGDLPRLCRMVEATGFFRPDEVAVAVELVEDRLRRGEASDYRFVIAEDSAHGVVGYACYGEIPCTIGSFDLYWIVVDPARQGRGVGRLLVRETERLVRARGGRRIWAETSGRADYGPTRAFYRAMGYERVALLPDFYAPGDPKEVYASPPLGAPPPA